jgi:hypothetical protein
MAARINWQRAGGFVALIAGEYGVIAAGFVLIMQPHRPAVIRAGWDGGVLSLLAIGLGALAIGEKARYPGALLICVAVFGMAWEGWWQSLGAGGEVILGGFYLMLAMVLFLFGGVLILIRSEAAAAGMEARPGE